jgi:CHAD domain-containing protein
MMRTARVARDAAHARLAGALTARRYRRFMTRLNTWLDGQGWISTGRDADGEATPARVFARTVLNRRLSKIRKRAKALEGATAAELHALRIEIKKLRYGFEFFHTVLPERRAVRVGRLLKALQDSLGHLNDLDVAGRTIAGLSEHAGDADTREAVSRIGTKLTAKFKPLAKSALPEAVKVAERLRAQKPL